MIQGKTGPMITTRKLSKRYRKNGQIVTALEDLNLEIQPGEFVIIRGRSGSGKTTLLNLLAALARPSQGEIEVAGVRLDRLSSAAAGAFRASHVGMVFQMFHLIPYLSLRENVLLPVLAGPHGSLRAHADELLAEFGLAGRAGHLPGELSAGERQRGAIARAILRRPDLLLADEPTGNLDPENAAVILNCLKKYSQAGKTVVMVTHHDLPGSRDTANRVLTMHEGRLATDTPVSEHSLHRADLQPK